MESIRKRPAGVTVIAVLALAIGIVDLLQGVRILGYVVFGPATVFSNVSLTGWLTVLLGLLWIVVGGAFLSLRPWAWFLGVFVVAISLVEAFFGSLNGWQFGDMFMAMIIPVLILFWLQSDKVKSAFGMEG